MTDFELLLKKGQVGEQVALDYFKKLTEVKDRTDYNEHKFYQKKVDRCCYGQKWLGRSVFWVSSLFTAWQT